MANEGTVVLPGEDTKVEMWTEPDPPDFEYASVGHGFVFVREGAGQLDWGPTGIGVKGGQTFMVTPKYVGIPEGPGLSVEHLAEKTIEELLEYSAPGATGLPAFGPRIDELDDDLGSNYEQATGDSGIYRADDQGDIIEDSIGSVVGWSPKRYRTTSIRYSSMPFDMGVRKLKNIQSVEVHTSLVCPIYVGILSRVSPQEPFRDEPSWSVIKHPVQRAGFNVGGIEFVLCLWAQGYGHGAIEGITVNYKLMDQTGLHSRPTLLRGAG